MKKSIFIILIVLLILVLPFGVKLFLIGEPVDGKTLSIQVSEGEGQVSIYVQVTDSAMAISHVQYHSDGTVLQISLRKVLASPLHHNGGVCLYHEITEETEIWLGGRQIWTSS